MLRLKNNLIVNGFVLPLLCMLPASLPALMPVKPEAKSPLAKKAFALPETRIIASPQPLDAASRLAGVPSAELSRAVEQISNEAQGPWLMHVDSRTGTPALWEGVGLPWIPGTANKVSGNDLGLSATLSGREVPTAVVVNLTKDYMRRHASLFPARLDELELNVVASGPILDYLYFIDYNWKYAGIPVEFAHVVFRLNHGNLVQVGQENISDAIRTLRTTPDLTVATAWDRLAGITGGQSPADQILEPGRLLIQPVSTSDEGYGRGTAYRLVWVLAFHRTGEQGTWEGRVDAHSGEVLSFLDTNAYGQTRGGTYANEYFAPAVNRPFGYVDCASGAGPFSNSAGVFAGTSCTSNLNGQYVRSTDNCGATSLTTAVGDLNFSTSGGTDCTTPGIGGAGNTHASRTQFYNLNLIKEKARTYLPANAWLNAKITANVNLNNTCNAYWNGTTVNFFRSGGGCANTGELMGVSMHEWGHGMDANDGQASANGGTGENYGDVTAVLQTHESCMGNGFLGGNCGGYGDDCLSCTGIRDLDYAKHASNKPHFPEDMTSDVCVGCTAFACPADACAGPCGRECHCEGLIPGEAVWDLATRDLIAAGLDSASAWQALDRLWYASRPTAASAFACPTITTTNGCAVGNLFTIFRVVDDSDGNPANGTPNAAAIFAAFNRHKISCGLVGDASNQNQVTCPSLSSTAVTATPTTNSVVLNWFAVTNATRYFIYRNELGCDAGFTKIATVAGGATVTYTDNLVVNGVTYYYRIQAAAASDSCTGAMSACVSPTPLSCTPPAAPTGISVTPGGTGQLNVSWSAVGGATQYKVYRTRSLSQQWTEIATVSSGITSYLDTGLYSGTTYFYTVRAFAGCLSASGTPASATTTGLCNIPPTFAGLATATNGLNASCQNALTWAAGSSNCGGTLTYNVYRSDVPIFDPAAATPIATGIAGLTYTDTAALFNANYYYNVRAVDSVAGTPDANTVIRAAAATGAATVIQSQNWEAANTWTAANGTPAATTGAFVRGTPTAQTGNYGNTSQPGSCHGGTQCYFTAVNTSPGVDDIDNGEVMATSPAINATGFPTVGLDLWRWYFNGETDDVGDYYVLEVSNNGGTNYTTIETILDSGPNDKNGLVQKDWANVNVRLESFIALTNNMRIRMRAAEGPPNAGNGNDPGDLGEAAIDDFTVTGYASCTVCTPPAAPTGVTATPNGANRIDLSWNAVAGAVGYQIYRVQGACGSGYTPLAFVAGTSYSDLSVVGTYAYAYVVRAVNGSDCPSVNSTCSSATATGVCNVPPTFAGATTVTNNGTASCGLTVNWAAATATCPAPTLRYNIYRSTSSSFTPSSANRVASCQSGTSYSDTGVVYDTRYYYTVRAEQGTAPGSGPCGGIEDANTVIRNATPSGASSTQNVFFDNFEAGTGLNGWSTGFFAGNATDWRGIQTCAPAQSGTRIFKWGGLAACTGNYANNVASLATPPGNTVYGMRIPESATATTLSFWHTREFGADDGSLLFLQLLPDTIYTSIPTASYTLNPPTTVLAAGTSNALGAGWTIWTGTQATMVNTRVNLESVCSLLTAGGTCAGKTMNLAFTGSSNAVTNANGWFVDDVQISASVGASCTTASSCAMSVTVSPALTTTVPVGTDIVFSVSHSTIVNGMYTYQWTRDGVDIAGAVLSSYAANESVAGSHTFNVKVSDGVSCVNVQDVTASTGTWTGGSPAPKPVPDGLFVAGTPMRATKSGGNLALTWDGTACVANNYSVFWGSISGGYTALTGGACAVGTSGTWTGAVPDGSWYVIVGTDGSQYSSFGRNSAGAEEAFTGAAAICPAYTTQSTSATCP